VNQYNYNLEARSIESVSQGVAPAQQPVDDQHPSFKALLTKLKDVQDFAQSLSELADGVGSTIIVPSRTKKFDVVRSKYHVAIYDQPSAMAALNQARNFFSSGNYNEGIDIYEQLSKTLTAQEIEVLAELYDQYQKIPQDRYSLYVSRCFDFGIKPGDRVLDIGSGHHPFPLATHLADIAPDDNNYGRAGTPMKYVEGKPFFACGVEQMPFKDKEFDFVYCSHVLEHVHDPDQACRELARVAKRGYVETPSIGKDIWLNTAKVSNHLWSVEALNDQLVFTEYSTTVLEGIGSNILMSMHCEPQTPREKAFSALILLKSDVINTSMYWEDTLPLQVRKRQRK
jgi:ubiquinone/menaquinone biosynthesis C-methylase UbiE